MKYFLGTSPEVVGQKSVFPTVKDMIDQDN